jgi:hypothetical protein
VRFPVPCLLLALAGLLASPLYPLRGQFFQSDDFNDGNDTGWTRYNPFAAIGAPNLVQWSFPNGTYRIRTVAPSPNPSLAGPGRGGSYRPEVYTNFYVSVDIVNWDDTLPHAAGILARVQSPGLGTTTGYAFTWDRGNPSSSTAGDVDFSRITGEIPTGVNTTGSDRLHMEPGKSYRFVFIGRGPSLEGRVYELPNVSTPIVAVTGSDATYEYGVCGLVIYDNSGGGGTNVCDITFDNYYATDIEPPRLTMTPQPFGDYEVSWPLDASVYVLQRSTSVAEGWEDVPAFEVVNRGDRYAHPFNPESDGHVTRFYRLIRRPAAANN